MKSKREIYAEKFADYLVQWVGPDKIKAAEVARRSKLSRQTISTIIGKKPNHLTGKLSLPEIDSVDALADAIGRPRDEARLAAGYAPEEVEKDVKPDVLDRTEDPEEKTLINVEWFVRMGTNFEELTQEEQQEYGPILKQIAENVERRAQRRKK